MARTTLLLAISLFMMLCIAQSASMLVPAVVGENGGQMVHIQVELQNGTGLIYTTTAPLVGLDTQASERTAVAIGINRASKSMNNYDAFLTMDANANQVDGPSAGAAMALLTISALEDKTMRSDFTITGTIESNGAIGAVGGISYKVDAANASGIKVVAIPASSDLFDIIQIDGLRQKYNLTIVEVGNIAQAESVAFSNGAVPQFSSPTPTQLGNIPKYTYACNSCNVDKFGQIANRTIQRAESEFDNLSQFNNSVAYSFINASLSDATKLYNSGYYYAGANTAFLAQVDIKLLANSAGDPQAVDSILQEVRECNQTLARPQTNINNLWIIAGGDLRREWENQKMADLATVMSENEWRSDSEAVLSIYQEAAYALNWCEVSRDLYAAALQVGGEPVNESQLFSLASTRLEQARDSMTNVSDSDLERHLRGAEGLFNDSRFAASIMDSDYVRGFKQANASILSANSTGTSFWSAIFFNHAKFLNMNDQASAAKIATMASFMDQDAADTKSVLLSQVPAETPTPEVPSALANALEINSQLNKLVLLLCALLVASALLNIVLVSRMRPAEKPKHRAKPRRR